MEESDGVEKANIYQEREEDEKDIIFMHSEEYSNVCNTPPKIKGRAILVHKLIASYKLLEKMRIEAPPLATKRDLTMFHCETYINCLERIQEYWKNKGLSVDDDTVADDLMSSVCDMDEHGIGYDCEPFKEIFDFVRMVAGGTIRCAELLGSRDARIAINLNGGWHHSHRDEAAGFCYVNDIVLGILKLREQFEKVLYIDMDIHHGDAVEEAFASTDKVMTVSFHKYHNGFFPGTGNLSDVGMMRGKYHTVNVPLKESIDDEQYYGIFTRVIDEVKKAFQPNALVCQCGADALSGDPLGGFNLTSRCISDCVSYVNRWQLPLLVVGGGGYNFTNTSKCWTTLLAALVNEDLDSDIPDHEFYSEYSPLFDINITPSVRKSSNTEEYIDQVVSVITENMKKIKSKTPINIVNDRTENHSEDSLKAGASESNCAKNNVIKLIPSSFPVDKHMSFVNPNGCRKRVFQRNIHHSNYIYEDENNKNVNNTQSRNKFCSKISLRTLDPFISSSCEQKDIKKQKTSLITKSNKRSVYAMFDFDET